MITVIKSVDLLCTFALLRAKPGFLHLTKIPKQRRNGDEYGTDKYGSD